MSFDQMPANTPPFQCAAIIGMGLIGGSLGLAIRERRLARRILGVDQSADALNQAVDRGAIDHGTSDLEDLHAADFVVFALPVGCLCKVMALAAPHVAPTAILTDVCSVKRSIVSEGERLFGDQFIGGHPMAGSEMSGIGSARSDLFDQAPWAICTTRTDRMDEDAVAGRVASFVTDTGARPLYLTPERHDHFVALISHLPHALSFAYSRSLHTNPDASLAVQIAGASYRDLTRIAQSSPELWADIFVENRDELLPAIAAFETSLRHLRAAILSGERGEVVKCLKTITT